MVDAFWGEIIEESQDSGPYKKVKMRSDGHEFPATVIEPYGLQGSAIKGGMALVIPVNGDMGQAVVIPMPPPKDRVDGHKPGEARLHNHKHGQNVLLDDSGNVLVRSPNGIVHINPPE